MIAAPTVEPLAWYDAETPILYGALGAIFHLEVLAPEDEERLERACALIWDWFGPELRWSLLSCADSAEPARPAHLEYISTHAASLRAAPAPQPDYQPFHNKLTKLGRDEYYVTLVGGDEPGMASPYSCRFWAEIGNVPEQDLALPAYSVLHLTVPEAWPLEDFHARVCAVAAELRLRWGGAGYTYSPAELVPGRDAEQALYAHARRHVGYDVPAYVNLTRPFHEHIRSVNWLTFVGEALASRLAGLGRPLAGTPNVAAYQVGGACLLRAGAAPERGDVNRLWIPVAYREADALVRPIRTDGKGLDFLNPWDETTTEQWIRRFEYRVF